MKKIVFISLAAILAVGLLTPSSPAAEPIVVGSPTSFYTASGWGALEYSKIALEEINAKGGVNVGGVKRPLKIVTADTRGGEPGTPVHEALMAYEKMILEEKPDVINIGAFRSEVLMAVMDLVAKYKIPHMGGIAQTPKFRDRVIENPEKYKYLFRCTTHSHLLVKFYLAQLHDYLKEKYGLTKIIFMAQDSLWNTAVVETLREYCIKTGWQDLGYSKYAGGATDFSPFLIKAKKGGAQVIVNSFDVPLGAGNFVKQLVGMKLPAILTGFSMPLASPAAWETMGPGIEYALQVEFPAGCTVPLKKRPGSVEILEKYKKMFNRLPMSSSTISGYMGMYILADAMERAGTLDADALVAALEKTDLMLIPGRCRFDEGHQLIYGLDPKESALSVIVQWVKPGVRVAVYPPAVADAEIQMPKMK